MEDMARLALVEFSIGNAAEFITVLYEMLRFINNILENPHDYTLRTLESDFLKSYLRMEEFQDYLKYIGFTSTDNYITYPREQTLSKLRIAQATIERKISFCSGTLIRSKTSVRIDCCLNNTIRPKLVPTNILKTKNPFLLKIETFFNYMIRYEDDDLQQEARELIPIVTLRLMAIDRVRERQRKIKEGETNLPELAFDIALLMELMLWFKEKFFEWMSPPECIRCSKTAKFAYHTSKKIGTEVCVVEVYACLQCNNRIEFARHNDVRVLLKTRRGRCGEWASCFTLFCRTLGYETRYVYDTTDHVWCEVFDYDANVWVHVDPCETKMNAPLLYSHGWGKKLCYVIAFSKDDLQDVTWRYTTQHKEVLKRRTLCTESELLDTILAVRERRQRQVSEPRRQHLARRAVLELVQLMVEREPKEYEEQGRVSGSKEWREARNENGTARSFTFMFSKPGDLMIKYHPGPDEYMISGPEACVIKEWSNGTHAVSNIFRKQEHDWKMVYLARQRNEEPGVISWKLAARPGLLFTVLHLRAGSETYEDGKVKWEVSFDGGDPMPAKCRTYCTASFERCFNDAVITCTLYGGSGELAWQHAQLFRVPAAAKHADFHIHATVAPRPPPGVAPVPAPPIKTIRIGRNF